MLASSFRQLALKSEHMLRKYRVAIEGFIASSEEQLAQSKIVILSHANYYLG